MKRTITVRTGAVLVALGSKTHKIRNHNLGNILKASHISNYFKQKQINKFAFFNRNWKDSNQATCNAGSFAKSHLLPGLKLQSSGHGPGVGSTLRQRCIRKSRVTNYRDPAGLRSKMGMQQQLHHVLHEMSWYQVTLTLTSERMEGLKPRTFSWTWNILKLSQMLILPRRESVNRLDLLDLPHALPHQASRPMPAGDPPWVSGHVPSRYDMIYLDIFRVTTEIPGNQWQCSLGIMKSCISLVESSFFKTHQKSWNA